MTPDAADPTVSALTERELLAAILTRLGPGRALVGAGDDAAVLAAPGERIVASVDTLVEGPDFRLAWSSGFDLGWKSAAVNLADIAAMGASPTALLVALTLPPQTRLSFVLAIADGLRGACAALAPECAVEGGDLTVSRTLTVAVTALGTLAASAPVVRSGARAGDVLALCGDAGIAARGLAILFDRWADADGTARPTAGLDELDAAERHAVSRQLRPHPPIAAGVVAARSGATAMMDVSDGLALDASRLAAASGVTVDIDSALLGGDEFALAGGEDHALLAAFPPTAALPDGFRAIGAVVPAAEGPVRVDGVVFSGRGGWDPYRSEPAAG
ncbi:thiamine-phosphate kinase [Microbacterium fluvii]|uniref:Thiamine-monophosphate kinase n=1 Tax=Microbacterium fluvii TaxID=415215 RepID=A0ABW2HEV9_9MICO|nr:thiamine-phosphate kinase [Microbacterium fluvii]MCU4672121.1 thiamine-phosphate kinase [Microbacterium fluvii]